MNIVEQDIEAQGHSKVNLFNFECGQTAGYKTKLIYVDGVDRVIVSMIGPVLLTINGNDTVFFDVGVFRVDAYNVIKNRLPIYGGQVDNKADAEILFGESICRAKEDMTR